MHMLRDLDPWFLVCLALFIGLCHEGAFWWKDAVRWREWVKPMAFFGAGFYFMGQAILHVLSL